MLIVTVGSSSRLGSTASFEEGLFPAELADPIFAAAEGRGWRRRAGRRSRQQREMDGGAQDSALAAAAGAG